MGKVRNTMELIKKANGIINNKYDMHTNNINDIIEASNASWSLVYNGFQFGYVQGLKAAKAEKRVVK